MCFLILGASLLLSGIIFFFAWNWEGMARWQRLALAAVGILLPALSSRLVVAGELVSKLLLLSACIMTGVFLAVFGQEYQTGADTHGLFFGWALLILPWVLYACFEPLWIIWLLLFCTGLSLYWSAVLMYPPATWKWTTLMQSLSLIHAGALAIKEVLAARGAQWLKARWSRCYLLILALALPTMQAVAFVARFELADDDRLATGFLFWLGLALLSFWIYRYKLRDAAAMSLPVISSGILVTWAAIRWIWELLEAVDESVAILGAFFLYTGVIGVIIAGWVALLRRLAQQMAEEEGRASLAVPPPLPSLKSESEEATWRSVLRSLPEGTRQDLEGKIETLAKTPREPVWLKAVSAVSGWVAAWSVLPMLFVVLGVLWDENSSIAMMTCGLIFLGASVVLSRVLPSMTFVQQMNLALALGSWSLFNGGFLTQRGPESLGIFALFQCTLAAVTYPLYKNSAYRFLVAVWATGSVVVWQVAERDKTGGNVALVIGVLAIASAALWAWRTRPEGLNPLAYAAAFSLASTVMFYSLVSDFAWLALPGSPRTASLAIATCLVALVAALNRGIQSLKSPWVIGLVLLTLPLALTGETGVLTAMLLTAAAYAWGDKLMGAFAWVFLAGFLFLFYYHMAVPLSVKSAIIGGSGLAFLCMRYALLRYASTSHES